MFSSKQGLISVICTAYNTKSYMKRCIDSVLSQTYSRFELILVDDGCTDGAEKIMDEYANRDIRVRVIHQSNKGHSEGRNVGLAASNGEYIYFIDSDDYIHPQALELLLHNLKESGANLSIGGLCRNGILPQEINNQTKVLTSIQALHILVDSVQTNYMNRMFLPVCATWNKLYKKLLFDNIKFPSGHIHDDNARAHRLLYAAEKIVITSAETYSYTHRREGIVCKGLYDNDMVLAYEDRIQFFKEVGLSEFLPLTYLRYSQVLLRTYDRLKSPELVDKLRELKKVYSDFELPEDFKLYKTIGLYYKSVVNYNGVTSWLYNFVMAFNRDYHLVIFTINASSKIKTKFGSVCTLVEVDGTKEYKCDILLNNCPFEQIPNCIKFNKQYGIIHCDFGRFLDRDDKQFDPTIKYIAVSDVAAEGMRKYYKVDCDSIEGLMVKDRPRTSKVLHLISVTRFTSQKGFANLVKFADMLKDNSILFTWLIFCDSNAGENRVSITHPEMIRMPSVDNSILMNYVADADYLVQLSESEGFGMVIHESLLVGTPVIASNIPVFSKYVEDGQNGYLVPHDIDSFDVKKILNIPRYFLYDTRFDELRQKWVNLIEQGD